MWYIAFIGTVIEYVVGLDSSGTPLLVSEDQINPFVEMQWYVLGFLHTDYHNCCCQTAASQQISYIIPVLVCVSEWSLPDQMPMVVKWRHQLSVLSAVDPSLNLQEENASLPSTETGQHTVHQTHSSDWLEIQADRRILVWVPSRHSDSSVVFPMLLVLNKIDDQQDQTWDKSNIETPTRSHSVRSIKTDSRCKRTHTHADRWTHYRGFYPKRRKVEQVTVKAANECMTGCIRNAHEALLMTFLGF